MGKRHKIRRYRKRGITTRINDKPIGREVIRTITIRTVIPAGTSLEALIRQATIESINPTATVSATGSIAYNVTAGTLTVNMTSAVNNPGATITGFVLSYRRGSGAWVQLYTGAAKTSHTHTLDALLATDNTSSFTYQLVVTDSTGASTTVTSNAITPAAYAAPTYSVTTPFSTSREMGDISTLISRNY